MIKDPTIFLGYSFERGNPRPWKFFKVPNIMVNAYDFLKTNQPQVPIHKLLSYRGFVFCDSGGWQVLQGESVDIFEIIKTQREMSPNLSVMLDNGLDEKQNIKNLKTYIENADFDFIPAFPYNTSVKSLKKISKLCQPSMIGVGGIVPTIRAPTNYPDLKNVLNSVKKIREHFPESKLHVFGVGGLYTAMIILSFVDSIDTSSWLHDSRFGKIRLLGKGVFCTHPLPNNPHLTEDEYDCKCPICKKHSFDELDQRGVPGMQLRALHNAWVLMKEAEIIKKELKSGQYFEYLDKRVQSSPRHLLKLVSKELGGKAG